MKALSTIVVFLSLVCSNAFGQHSGLYSNDSLLIDSEYLQESILVNLHLPETIASSADSVRYPITIIFDSQHADAYPHMISAIDMLTNETQIPEMIVIGIPFNYKNRFYLTSGRTKENDSLSGIQRLELFLFDELIPKIRKEYKANDFIGLFGHSRTGFLVNYLAYHRSEQINFVASLSGFLNETGISTEQFASFLAEEENFSGPFSYYCISGTTIEESSYLSENKALDSLLKDRQLPKKVKTHFSEQQNVNHITNYWMSVPFILVDAFADYNSILDSWLHQKLMSGHLEDPISEFKSDLGRTSSNIGFNLLPSVTHIYSLAGHYKYQTIDYGVAMAFIDLGLSYFPEYLGFHIEKYELYLLQKESKKAEIYKELLRDKIQTSENMSESEKSELMISLFENE